MLREIDSYQHCIDYVKNNDILKFDAVKLKFLQTNFITENSKDIPDEMLQFAINDISRVDYVIKLYLLIDNIKIAKALENGIFEHSLIHTSVNGLDKTLVYAIYNDQFYDIYENLNEKGRISNISFRKAIFDGTLNPALVGFLSPYQINPDCWEILLKKINFKQDLIKNTATTDIYKCYKCGERKMQIMFLQLRGSDEPTSKLITCMVCYSTFMK